MHAGGAMFALHSGDKISGKQAKVQIFFVGMCMQEAA